MEDNFKRFNFKKRWMLVEISTNIHRCLINIFHEFKSLEKGYKNWNV